MAQSSDSSGNNKQNKLPQTPETIIDEAQASSTSGPERKKPTLKVEPVEPRIMLSATWADATDGADTFDGTAADDYADGLAGDDILSGDIGDDHLLGNLGDDILDGGLGDDILDGGDGTDTADFSDASSNLDIDLSAGTATGDGTDTLIDIENAIGSNHNDTFSFTAASDGQEFSIDGGSGSDVLDLGDYSIQDATFTDNTIEIDLADGGSFSVTHENIGQVQFSDSSLNVEYGTNNTEILVAGNNGEELVVAYEGNNIVQGYNNDNVITTGSGHDIIAIGHGDNFVSAGDGNNQISTGHGENTVIVGDGTNSISLGHGVNTLEAGDGGNNISAGDGGNNITTGTGNDTITVGGGNDTVTYQGGNDTITLNAGNDTAVIADGQDGNVVTVKGGTGDDTLDLTAFSADSVHQDGSSITVDLEDGGSFTINHTGIENILTAPEDTNDAPEAVTDSITTNEDTEVTTANVLTNDTDADGDTLTVDSFTQAAHGTVTYNGDGTFSYTPDANYNGTDSFTYTVDDGNGGSDTATVNITVDAVNDGPVANDDTATTTEDNAVTTGNVLANDTDLDGDTLTVDSFTQAANGTVTYNNDGTFTYTPDANYNGADSFTYTISDGNGGTETATVDVTVDAVNDDPVANDDTATTTEDNAVTTGNVLANDTDLDGDTLAVDSFTQAANGTVTYNNDGTFTYTPDANYNGADSFTYTVSDGNGGTETATVEVTVDAVNDGPVANDDTATTDEDNAVTTGNVLTNDTDLDGDTLTVDSFTQAANGTVVHNGDGTFTYTPDADYNGADSFTYTVSDGNGGTETATVDITVNAVDDSIEAVEGSTDGTDNDDTFTFENAVDGSVFDIDGGDGTDTLDLSGYSYDDVTLGDGQLTVDMGNGESFTINHENVETLQFGDRTLNFVVWDGEGASESGSEAVNWNTDSAPGEDDILIFNNTSDRDAALDTAMVDSVAGIIISEGYDGDVELSGDLTVTGDLVVNSGQFDANGYDITIESDLVVSDGEFIASSGTTAIGGDMTVEADSFDHNNGTILFNGSGTQDMQADGIQLNDVSIDKPSGTMEISGQWEIRGDLTHTSGTVDATDSSLLLSGGAKSITANSDLQLGDLEVSIGSANIDIDGELDVAGDFTLTRAAGITGDTIAVEGNVTSTDSSLNSWAVSGTISLVGDGDQTISGGGVNGEICGLDISKTDGNILIDSDIEVKGALTGTGGQVAADQDGAIILVGTNKTIDVSEDVVLGDLEVNLGSGYNLTITDEVNISGDFTLTQAGGINGGTIAVQGDVTSTDASLNTWSVSGTISLVGDGDQTISGGGVNGEICGLDISKTDGNILIDSDIEVKGDLTGTGGQVADDQAGAIILVGQHKTIDTSDNVVLGDLEVKMESGHNLTITDTINVGGDFTLTQVAGIKGGTIAVEGNVTSTDTNLDTWSVSGTISLVGDGDQTISGGGANGEICGLDISKTDGNILIDSDIEVKGDLTGTGGQVADDQAGAIILVGQHKTIDTAADVVLGDLEVKMESGHNLSITDTVNVGGDFTLTQAAGINGGTIAVEGDVISTDTSLNSWSVSGTISMVGDGDQTISGGGANGEICGLDISKTDGNVLISSDIEVKGDLTGTGGHVADDQEGAIILVGNHKTVDVSEDVVLDDLKINMGSNYDLTFDSDLNVNGDLTIDEVNKMYDSIIYLSGNLTDNDGNWEGTTVINQINAAPEANDDIASTDEDVAVTTVNVLANDTDANGDTLTVDSFTQAANGTVTYNNDGTFTYTPDANYNGADSFTYTVSDGNGGTETATVEVNVDAVNDGPVANDDTATTTEDNAVTTGNVLTNDTDLDGDTLTVDSFTQAANGTVTYNDDGTFTYTPDANYNGADSFTYTVSDGNGGTETATVDINVDAVNDGPVANDDTATTTEDNAVTTGNVLANDTDLDGDTLTVDSFTQAANGTVTYNDDGTFTYTPDADYNGADSFTYTVSDGNGGTETATVEVNVDAVNDGPVANDDTATTTEDNAVTTGNVLANDTDLDGDTLTVDSFTQAANGTVTYNNDGTFTYTPDANYNGADSFTYTISDGNGGTETATVEVNVDAVNDGPVANDDAATTTEDNAVTTGNVLANDTDLDGDTLAVDSFTQAANGTVTYNNNGTFTYTPDANYNGADSFTYTVSDGNGGTETATVEVNVDAVNDGPVANDDTATTTEDNAVTTGNVLANDTDLDGDTLTVDSFTQATNGTVTYNNDGTFTYTPDANYHGADSFTYTVSDGNGGTETATVEVNVDAVNDGPVANDDTATTDEDNAVTTGNVLANDTDLDGDTLTVDSFTQAANGTVTYNNDGTFTYTPDANYNGADSFTYTVSDGNGGTETATVEVNVDAVNDGPVANDDTATTTEDNAVTTGNVLANDTDLDGDTLAVDSFTQAANGTVTYNNDGTFTYTPDANYNGADSFTYTISDGNGGTETATVEVNVDAVNDGPVANDDTATTTEDNAVTTGNVLANDTDLDGDTLSVDSFTQATNGTVTYNNDGTFTYTPDANYHGADSFTYTVSDGNGGTETATVEVNVDAVNDGPVANDDTATTTEDNAVTTGNVLANDTDLDGDTLTVDSFTQAAHGTVTYNNNGTFTYTPDANYNGADSFTYTVSDGNGGTETATVEVNVDAVNDGPVANDDTATTTEDNAVTTGNVLANDTDLDGDTLTVDSFTQAANGTVTYNDDGTFTYTPDANYNGADSFTYTISDGNGGTETATVEVNVDAVNDGPVANDDTATTTEDNAVTTGNVLANDTDLDGDTLTVDSFTQAANGTVTYNDDGTFTYTPDADYNGADSFTYTISDGNGGTETATVEVNVDAVNDGPVANDDTATTTEDNAVTTGNVLANDTDLDGDTLTVDSFTQAANGTVTYNDDGTFTYTPDANYNGADSFTYTVSDGNGGTETATVEVNVDAVNDGPVANDDAATTTEDNAVTTGNVLANDTDLDGDTLTVDSFTQATNGTVTYNDDGTFTYTPDANYNGADSFTYTISDGNGGTETATVDINVDAVNDGPVANDDTATTTEDNAVTTGNVLANDTDLDGDTLTVDSFTQAANGTVTYNDDGTFTYTPDANYNGADSFTYTVSDGNGGTETATVEVNVDAVNDGPVANDDTATTTEDNAVTTGNVLANDTDLDGDTLTVDSFTQAANGTVTYNNDGTFTYTPDANYNGADSFTYTVSDGNGGTETATVEVNVDAVNDGPVANDDTATTTEDNAVTTGNVLANDTDLDGDALTVDSFTQAANGTVTYNNDGTFTYTPDANYNGADSFTYTISDGNGGTETATVEVNVDAVNDDPVANDDNITTDEDATITTASVLANDTDLDGDNLSVNSFTQPAHGKVAYNDDGTFTYWPSDNYNGPDSFTYTVTDGNGGYDTATMDIQVNSINDAPDAGDDSVTTSEDTTVTTDNVLANDVDVDGDEVSLDAFTQAEHGLVTYNGDGTFTYTPDDHYTGPDSFTYTISDGNGGTETATVEIDVQAAAEDTTTTPQEDTVVEDSDQNDSAQEPAPDTEDVAVAAPGGQGLDAEVPPTVEEVQDAMAAEQAELASQLGNLDAPEAPVISADFIEPQIQAVYSEIQDMNDLVDQAIGGEIETPTEHEFTEASFSEVFEELPGDIDANYDDDADPASETPAMTAQPLNAGDDSNFIAGLWSLIRGAAGVSEENRTQSRTSMGHGNRRNK